MARPGVQFSDVKRAAEAIAKSGLPVTNARVRAHLGTGSNGTIGPYLREWKEGRTDEKVSPSDELQDHLLETTRQVYARLETRAQMELQRERERHAQSIAEITARMTEVAEKHAFAERALKSANDEVERVRFELVASQNLAQERLVENRELRAAAEATSQMLSDRAAEIARLRDQVEQGRTQFEHYATVTAREYEANRAVLQERNVELIHELREAHEGLKQSQADLQKANDHNAHLETSLNLEREAHRVTRSELSAVRESNLSAQSSLALAQGVGRQLEEQLSEKRKQIGGLRAELDVLMKETHGLKSSLAVSDGLVAQLRSQVASAESRLDRLLQSHVALSGAQAHGEDGQTSNSR